MSELVPYCPNDQRAYEAPPPATPQASMTWARRIASHTRLTVGALALLAITSGLRPAYAELPNCIAADSQDQLLSAPAQDAWNYHWAENHI